MATSFSFWVFIIALIGIFILLPKIFRRVLEIVRDIINKILGDR